MKQLGLMGLIGLVALATISIPASSTIAAPAQQVRDFAAETISAKATIVAIDRENRMVTLRGPRGNDVAVHADERVQRFNELKVGDIVTATYTEAVAVRVRKPGTAAPPKQTDSTVRQPDNRGATITREQNVTVVIQEIDLTAPSVTAEGPQKRQYTFRVRDKNEIKDLKVGDRIDVTYTEALLVRADRAQ
jgi:Cu/Ag efflux protein CusF